MFVTGTFIRVDERTEKKESLDVARVLISTKVHDVINYVERIDINGELFVIKVVEDWIVSKQRCEKCHDIDDNAAGEDDEYDDSGDEDLGDDDEFEFSDDEVEETMINDEGCNNQEANLNSIGLDKRVAADMVNIMAMRDNSKETQLIGNVGNCNNIIQVGAVEVERTRHVEGKKQVNNVIVGDENVLPCFDNSLNTNPNTNPIEAQPSPAGAKNSPEPVNPLPSPFTTKIRPQILSEPTPTLSARSTPHDDSNSLDLYSSSLIPNSFKGSQDYAESSPSSSCSLEVEESPSIRLVVELPPRFQFLWSPNLLLLSDQSKGHKSPPRIHLKLL